MTLVTLALLVVAVALPAQSTRMEPDPLARHRWTHRLLIVDVPDTAAGRITLQAFRTALEDEVEEVRDRDLLVVAVGELGRAAPQLRPALDLSPSERQAVRRRLGLEGREPQLVLIGKDGGVKARQSGVFDLPRILALIDTMPMRQGEVRRQ